MDFLSAANVEFAMRIGSLPFLIWILFYQKRMHAEISVLKKRSRLLALKVFGKEFSEDDKKLLESFLNGE